MTTFNRLQDGTWGIRSTETLATGQTVKVTKRDGQISTVTVGEIVWQGNGVTVASIQPSPKHAPSTDKPRRGGTCVECNTYSSVLYSVRDSSGIVGQCCPRCARLPFEERSFA